MIEDPLSHFQTERLRWISTTLPDLTAASSTHGVARLRCDLARFTLDQMIDAAPLPDSAAAFAAQIHQRCAIDLANAMLDTLVQPLSDPARAADPVASPCQTTVAPIITFLGDHPSDDPEVQRKRALVFDACPDFAARFRAFEAKREAIIRQQTTPPSP